MITILTPTYNRAYTLNRLYNSLCEQTNKRFNWLIVDDGSTDNTINLIEKLQRDNRIDIEYLYQENSGKHIAINNGVSHCSRDWVFIVDSDDILTNDAIKIVIDEIVNHQDHDQIIGLCFRRAFLDKKIIGNKVAGDVLRINPTKAAQLFQGDLAYIFKQIALQNNPFPTIADEKFVPELYVWNKIADQGQILFFPETYIYLTEYLEDGYSKNFATNLQKNPKGFKLFYQDQLKREKNWKNKLKCFIRSMQCSRYIAANNKKDSE